jgi:hypothetical protein
MQEMAKAGSRSIIRQAAPLLPDKASRMRRAIRLGKAKTCMSVPIHGKGQTAGGIDAEMRITR